MSRILLVEDDPMISDIYKNKMQEAGFDVAVSANGKEVIKKVQIEKFDLILLDLVLPDMSGMEVLRELKKSGKRDSEMKIVIFSNLDEQEDINRALEEGADGFLSKTQFNPLELAKEVKKILNGGGKADEKNKNTAGEALEKENVARVRKTEGGISQEKRGGPKKENAVLEKRGKNKKILFIEDEEIFIEMFGKKLLEENYEIEFAKNGSWGLKEALNKSFDLIITDMVMPVLGGKEIIERLKLDNKTKNIPIIVLSASVEDRDLEEVEKKGLAGCFIKTRIVPSDLVKKVNEILK